MRRFAFGAAALALAVNAVAGTQINQTNLITNNPVANPSVLSDPSLVNAWGVSMSSSSPAWVSDNGTGVATLYKIDPATQATTKVGLTISIPGDGSVTGQVFNPGTAAGAFNADNFLFVSEDGTVSGWRGALGTTAETLQAGSASDVYKGVALGSTGGNTYLYAANFRTGSIDVLKGTAGAPSVSGNFIDPNLPSGFTPFNVQSLVGKLYVTYAMQDAAKHDETDGTGLGFVDAFDFNGNLLSRIGTQGTLNAPWGLAIAPASFNEFAGDLLVGNFGDGRINAYDLSTNAFVGQLVGTDGNPLSIDGLWGLTTGNDSSGGSSKAVYFSAGPDGESNGLFGVLTPEPASLATLLAAAGLILMRRKAGNQLGESMH